MSATIAILRAIAGNPGATSEEISEAVAIDPIKVRKALHVIASPSQGPLVSRELDDVTKKPGYRLTDHGRKKLSKEPQGGKPKAHPEVAENTGSDAPVSYSSPGGVAVAKTPQGKPAETPNRSDGRPVGDVSSSEAMAAFDPIVQAKQKEISVLEKRCAALEAELFEVSTREKEGWQHAKELEEALVTEGRARQALQEQINAAPAIDIKDAARGYVVIAPKRKLRRVMKPEAARTAAMAAARNGSGRGEVYALVHVGTATRGAEWRGA